MNKFKKGDIVKVDKLKIKKDYNESRFDLFPFKNLFIIISTNDDLCMISTLNNKEICKNFFKFWSHKYITTKEITIHEDWLIIDKRFSRLKKLKRINE